jgi:uncharacterized alkaline shock family protein YloU
MGERRGEDRGNGGNPLVSGRGVTTVKNVVVQRIAGLAAQEVSGVHMGGGTARTVSRFSGGQVGAQEQTRGVSVDVGRTEVAIDLTMALDYGNDILQTVNRVRDRISARVQHLTGLSITELNVTVSDIVFPEDGEGRTKDETQSLGTGQPTQRLRAAEREPAVRESAERQTAEPETAHRGPLAEESDADRTSEITLDKKDDDEESR